MGVHQVNMLQIIYVLQASQIGGQFSLVVATPAHYHKVPGTIPSPGAGGQRLVNVALGGHRLLYLGVANAMAGGRPSRADSCGRLERDLLQKPADINSSTFIYTHQHPPPLVP